MASLELRDILDLPSNAAPRPNKKARPAGRTSNLKGLQREVQSLGGDNPIAIVPVIPQFKKKRFTNRKPVTKWDRKPFTNSARNDGLVLRHWGKKDDPPVAATPDNDVEGHIDEVPAEPILEDSAFAKYNVQVDTPVYDNDQYESKLKSQDWTKDETDYLMEVVKDFDLRWPVVWDRYEYQPVESGTGPSGIQSRALVLPPKARTMEDLKARYYEVAATMMAIHHPVQYMTAAEFNLHALMKSYNPEQERNRKKFAETSLARSPEERKEEESLLIELKRIIARTEKLNEERKELYARLDSPQSTSSQTALNVYTTSAGLSQLVQALMSADKSKKRRTLMPEGVAMPAPIAAVSTAPSRRDSLDRRDSIREPPASTPGGKKGSVAATTPNEKRALTKEEEAIYGISQHERLTCGPVFRHEKPTKMIHNKSAVVQQKMTAVLDQLEIPPRLQMPTGPVVAGYENLITNISLLLDIQKHVDKLDGEVKLLEAQRSEREKKAQGDIGESNTAEQLKDVGTVTKTEAEDQDNKNGGDRGGVEDVGDSAAPSTRASSSGGNKRSASVLSQASEQSSKRQRK